MNNQNNKNINKLMVFSVIFFIAYLIRGVIFLPGGVIDDIFFCNIGHSLNNGLKVYTDIADIKGPLFHYTFAFIDFITSDITVIGLRVFSVFITALSAIILYFIIIKLFESHLIASIISIYWVTIDFVISYSDVYTYTNIFLGFLVFSLYIKKNKYKTIYLFFTGFFMGIALLYSQRTFAYILIPIVFILIKHRFSKDFFFHSFITGIGFLIPILAIVVYFHINDQLSDMIFWIFCKAGAYAESKTWYQRLIFAPIQRIFQYLFFQIGILIITAIIQIKKIFKEKLYKNDSSLFILIWFFIGFLATFIDAKSNRRYNLYFLAPLMILGIQGINTFYQKYKNQFINWNKKKRVSIYFILVAMILGPHIWTIIQESNERILRYHVNQKKQEITKKYCNYLKEKIPDPKNEFIYLYPSHKYFDCSIYYRPATRFSYGSFHLIHVRSAKSPKFQLEKSWKYLFDDLKKKKPKIIIDTTGNHFYFKSLKNKKKEIRELSIRDKKLKGMSIEKIKIYFKKIQNSGDKETLEKIEQYINKLDQYVRKNYILDKEIDGIHLFRIKKQ